MNNPPPGSLTSFESLIGNWKADGKKSDGIAFHIELECEWALDKKLIKTRIFDLDNGRTRVQGEGFIAWHPTIRKYVFLDFFREGINGGEITVSENGLTFEFELFRAEGISRQREELTWISADEFHWLARREKAGEWLERVDTTFTRSP